MRATSIVAIAIMFFLNATTISLAKCSDSLLKRYQVNLNEALIKLDQSKVKYEGQAGGERFIARYQKKVDRYTGKVNRCLSIETENNKPSSISQNAMGKVEYKTGKMPSVIKNTRSNSSISEKSNVKSAPTIPCDKLALGVKAGEKKLSYIDPIISPSHKRKWLAEATSLEMRKMEYELCLSSKEKEEVTYKPKLEQIYGETKDVESKFKRLTKNKEAAESWVVGADNELKQFKEKYAQGVGGVSEEKYKDRLFELGNQLTSWEEKLNKYNGELSKIDIQDQYNSLSEVQGYYEAEIRFAERVDGVSKVQLSRKGCGTSYINDVSPSTQVFENKAAANKVYKELLLRTEALTLVCQRGASAFESHMRLLTQRLEPCEGKQCTPVDEANDRKYAVKELENIEKEIQMYELASKWFVQEQAMLKNVRETFHNL